MKPHDHSTDYTEESLWAKLGAFAKTAGREVVEKALTLLETLKDQDTPAWAKGVIIAALGYFISPADAIPDLVPFAGFADDLGALAVALSTVLVHIKEEHAQAARETMKKWFSHEVSPAPTIDFSRKNAVAKHPVFPEPLAP